jgi:glutathione peroxidase
VTDAIRPSNPKSVYDFSAPSIDGGEVSLANFSGRVLLVVNTASKCGLTPQYAGLEALYRRFKDHGLVVLGFPCNQFGAQEPGGAAEIVEFCNQNYGVSFPIFAKIEVNGAHAHPLYKFLKGEKSGILGMIGLDRIKWNFTKFLVDRKGQVVARFAPTTTPAELASHIDKLLC